MLELKTIIWFDENYDNEENIGYINELKENTNLKIKCFKDIEDGMKYIKTIEFEETNIIINGRLYGKFIEKFKEEINDIYIIPKIIIFAENENDFLKNNDEYENYINDSFYNIGGIKTAFKDIKNFILKPSNKKRMNRDDIIFEYIDNKEKLLYPIKYKEIMDKTRIDNIDKFTDKIYNKYQNNSRIKNFLNSIKDMQNIPIELLSKYYARLYTLESDDGNNNFYYDLNKDLKENKEDDYLPYIKILYEGIKSKSLPLGSNNILYRGTRLLNKEIEKIKNYLKYKNEGLPGSIVFSKTFLSFSKDNQFAKQFLKTQKNDNKFNKVLFILEKDDYIDYNLSTHIDMEKISFYPAEKEVLFLPFSSFEIKEINEVNEDGENIYIIKLLYLGKYIRELEKNKNIFNNIPNSEFKKQIIESDLINYPRKNLLNEFNEYKNEIEKDNTNYIISEIEIKKNDINKDIRIINSYEEYCIKTNEVIKDEYKNEKEIKDNIEININDEIIPFSYFHKFKEKGRYTIKYIFKNNLKNINHIFSDCKSLIKIDSSNLNTENLIDMSYIFKGCSNLKNITLPNPNLNGKNVINMKDMFRGCSSLKSEGIIYKDYK